MRFLVSVFIIRICQESISGNYLSKKSCMNPEYIPIPDFRKLPKVFGLSEQEQVTCRVSQDRFGEIFKDGKTHIHKVEVSTNAFGEFLFVTASRPLNQGRVSMTFYSLGYHAGCERWINEEWFFYQANPDISLLITHLEKTEAEQTIKKRAETIAPLMNQKTQTGRGKLFDFLLELTDEDAALAEIADHEDLDDWLKDIELRTPPEEPPPVGENLLDEVNRSKLPALYSNEELGLAAKAQVKFFTPDSNWTWYASEFDGKDVFFGLVSGFDAELGYFTLSELKEARGPMGLQIERDLHFEPKTLGELLSWHRNQKNG